MSCEVIYLVITGKCEVESIEAGFTLKETADKYRQRVIMNTRDKAKAEADVLEVVLDPPENTWPYAMPVESNPLREQ